MEAFCTEEIKINQKLKFLHSWESQFERDYLKSGYLKKTTFSPGLDNFRDNLTF